MEEQKIAGMIIICTGKYDIFLQPLVDSMDKYLLRGHEIDLYLFSDKGYTISVPKRMTKTRIEIPHLPFPIPTLYRYKWISEHSDKLVAKNLYYLDVDMLFVNKVGEEILPDDSGLVATRHPGFYHGGWGDHGTKDNSLAYLSPDKRQNYYAGGFQGGDRYVFIEASNIMADHINTDYGHGVIAQWNDESHWNWYLKHHAYKELSPEYCMVEEMKLRRKWGIDNLTPRLIALKKDHIKIRT